MVFGLTWLGMDAAYGGVLSAIKYQVVIMMKVNMIRPVRRDDIDLQGFTCQRDDERLYN